MVSSDEVKAAYDYAVRAENAAVENRDDPESAEMYEESAEDAWKAFWDIQFEWDAQQEEMGEEDLSEEAAFLAFSRDQTEEYNA